MSCSNPEYSDKLIMYLDKDLPTEEYKSFQKHIQECPDCREELETLRLADELAASGVGDIKRGWRHPSPEELAGILHEDPGISQEHRLKIANHISNCPLCREELELMREAPVVGVDVVEEEAAFMPALLKEKYNELYGGKRSRADSPINVQSIKPPGLWERMRNLLSPSMKFAYVSMAALLFIVIVFGLLFAPSVVPGDSEKAFVSVSNDDVKYVEFAMNDSGEKDKEDFVLYLRKIKIPARLEEGKVLVQNSFLEDMRGHYGRYRKDQELTAMDDSGGPPSDFVPVAKGNGMPPQASPYPGTVYDNGNGNSSRKPVPNLAEDLEKTIKYPKISPETEKPAAGGGSDMIPMPKPTAAGEKGADSGKKENVSPTESPDPQRKSSLRTAAPAKGEGGKTAVAAKTDKGTTPVEEVFLKDEGKSGEIEFPRREEPDEFIPFDNLDEREKRRMDLQDVYEKKITTILKSTAKTKGCKARVTVILSPGKDQWGEYQVRSVTIHIYHPRPLNNIEKAKLKEKIQREMEWKGLWDKQYEFHPF